MGETVAAVLLCKLLPQRAALRASVEWGALGSEKEDVCSGFSEPVTESSSSLGTAVYAIHFMAERTGLGKVWGGGTTPPEPPLLNLHPGPHGQTKPLVLMLAFHPSLYSPPEPAIQGQEIQCQAERRISYSESPTLLRAWVPD